jgi:hypothetical protein
MIGSPRHATPPTKGTAVPVLRRAVLAATLALGLAVAAGCAGGADSSSGDAPEGWTEVTDNRITVQHPADWQTQPPSGEKWTHRLVGDGMEMQVSGAFSDDVTASGARSRLDLQAMVGLDGYVDGGVDAISVEGADSAVRSDFTYEVDGTPMKGVWLVAGQWPYPATAVVAITGERLDEAVIEHVVDTMTFNRRTS